MIDSPELFPPIARNSDVWTSHAAAREFIQSGKRESQHCRIVALMLSDLNGGTALEMEVRLDTANGGSVHCHKRCPELVRLGLVRRGEPRVCRVSGMRAVTWWLV